jgi:glutathione S-transferase
MKERNLKLHYLPLSTNARKPRLVAAMLDIPLELVDVDLAKGEQRRPQFLALNAFGRVPVLEDGDFVLAESAAIMAYLADTRSPGNPLYPGGARERDSATPSRSRSSDRRKRCAGS